MTGANEADDLAPFTELAIMIAGRTDIPAGLAAGLRQAALHSIPFTARMQTEFPHMNPRAKQTYFIERREECRRILDMLHDYKMILELNDGAGYDEFDGQHLAENGLALLVKQLDAAIASDPDPKKGRHWAYSGTSPQLACAIFVAEAWRLMRGALPQYTAEDPQRACEYLWGLTGLSRVRYGNTDRAWEPHLRHANQELEAGGYQYAKGVLARAPQC